MNIFKRALRVNSESLINDEIREQMIQIAELKKIIEKQSQDLILASKETHNVINLVSLKFQTISKRALKFNSSINSIEGVAFINHCGEIIHINDVACNLLNMNINMPLQRIDYILTGKQKKISFDSCSRLIMQSVNSHHTFVEVCDTARTALLLKTEDVAIHLDEPICFVFKSGNRIKSLRVVISLLDISPSFIDDITYVCKISKQETIEENIPKIEIELSNI